MQPHPQKFWFGENPGKIKGYPGKICENLRKIPENLGKLPKNTSKNSAQRAVIWEDGAQNHMKTFFWRSSKIRSSCNAQMMAQKIFGQDWENLGKNPWHPQKCACSYTYVFLCEAKY